MEIKKTAKAMNISPDRLEWSKTSRVRMAHALTEHFCTDKAVKAKRISATEDLTSTLTGYKGSKILQTTTDGVCKVISYWNGGFEVKEQLDKDTYVICKSEDSRRKFIAHRETLRVIGDPMKENFVKGPRRNLPGRIEHRRRKKRRRRRTSP